MPRASLPPTPTDFNTGMAGQDRSDMESAFSLPPPAMPGKGKLTNMQSSPPASPGDKPMSNSLQRKRTLSGTAKTRSDNVQSGPVDLPPPPSRARKIIQMKPKQSSGADDTAATPQANGTKAQTSPKRKQPSATSAAGRKIARKTAHSIIERRRRSKMNEEFGVLKDMIPACKGVEMHKLAILQAGIDYVKYLQGCVEQLQDQRGSRVEDDEDFEATHAQRHSSSGSDGRFEYRRGSVVTATTISTNPSPALRPTSSSQAGADAQFIHPSTTYSTSPPPMMAQTPLQSGVSPAFNAIHFSPDLARNSAFSSTAHGQLSGKPSPNILPLPQAALPMPSNNGAAPGEGAAEATATAALMMLTNDRRGTSRGRMSVKELLSG